MIGNTIRLHIENRRTEIEVIKLVGGTDSYVRRPFLYMGALYGFGAGVLSWAEQHNLLSALPKRTLTFDRSDLSVTAAMSHAGIAIGRQQLVQKRVDRGELVLNPRLQR